MHSPESHIGKVVCVSCSCYRPHLRFGGHHLGIDGLSLVANNLAGLQIPTFHFRNDAFRVSTKPPYERIHQECAPLLARQASHACNVLRRMSVLGMVEEIIQGAELYVRTFSCRVTLAHLYTCNISRSQRRFACFFFSSRRALTPSAGGSVACQPGSSVIEG